MKSILVTLLVLFIYFCAFSQSGKYGGRFSPTFTKERLNHANFIEDIMPDFSSFVSLSANDYTDWQKQMKLIDQNKKLTTYTTDSVYQLKNYNHIIDILSVDVFAMCYGKEFSATSKNDVLTPEQKNILYATDLGSEVTIKLRFKYKSHITGVSDINKIIDGTYVVTVVPETEAQFPGGYEQVTDYLVTSVKNRIKTKGIDNKILNSVVGFTVNEDGEISDVRIIRTSTDDEIDRLLLDAADKMPRWKPAKNSKGLKVKQAFSVAFGGGC